jgi:hypothetical protein
MAWNGDDIIPFLFYFPGENLSLSEKKVSFTIPSTALAGFNPSASAAFPEKKRPPLHRCISSVKS